MVALQKSETFRPTPTGQATRAREFAARVSYLEGICKALNAYRGEES
jgi:hypothetical protein